MNHWIRQIHRWLSVAFTVGFVANLFALSQPEPIIWVGMMALLPLLLLLVSGLYLFALPYAVRWRSAARVTAG